MMKLTTLANGLKVASRTDAGRRDGRGRPLCRCRLAARAGAGQRHRPPLRAYGVQGRRRALGARDQRGDRGCRRRAQRLHRARRGPASPPPCSPSICRSAIELSPTWSCAPHFDADDLAREKEVVLQELGEARDTPGDIIFDDLWTPPFPTSRSAARSSATRRASPRSRATTPRLAARAISRRAASILVAAGKVDHDSLVALAEARFGVLPEGTIAPAEAARFGGGVRAEPAQRGAGPSRRRLSSAGRARCRLLRGARCSATSSAAAPRRGCSRRCARSGGWLIRSGRRSALSRWRPLLLLRRHRPASRPPPPRRADRRGRRRHRRDASQRELDRARAQAKAGLLLSLESSLGPGLTMSRRPARRQGPARRARRVGRASSTR